MRLEHDIAQLMRVELFQGFQPEQLRLLAFGAEHERLRKGTILYEEGEEADGGYVVVSGQVDLLLFRGKRELVVDSCLEGALLGEVALITPNLRVTHAMARTDSEVLVISRRLFHRMLNEFPETAALIHRRISQSVSHTLEQLERVQGRLAGIPQLKIPAAHHPELLDDPTKDDEQA
ncbi:MAG: cyclic nucleotide-binding domain-containing protein [Rhizobiaceae bacterium]